MLWITYKNPFIISLMSEILFWSECKKTLEKDLTLEEYSTWIAPLNLKENVMQLFNMVAKVLEKNILYPDLVIFLQSDVDRLMENIRKRGRDYEKDIDWEYIAQLNEIYNQYFMRYNKSNLLVINTNDIDFVNDENDLNQILEVIRSPFSGTKFFNPIKKSFID